MKNSEIKRKTPPIRLVMFHFLCPLCGSKPDPRLLRDVLREWSTAPGERVRRLVCDLESALRRYGLKQPKWVSKRFIQSVHEVIEATTLVRQLLDAAFPRPRQRTDYTRCVVCKIIYGKQEDDRYFTEWERACRVQTANLLYETGLILWAIIREVPPWCDGTMLGAFDRLRRLLQSASNAMNVLECPVCRRPTTHLYGTDRPFCRCCLDMGGGLGIGLAIEPDGTIELIEPDPPCAVLEDADLLPPSDYYP